MMSFIERIFSQSDRKKNIIFVIPSLSCFEYPARSFVDALKLEFEGRGMDVEILLEPRFLFNNFFRQKGKFLFTLMPLKNISIGKFIFKGLYAFPIKLMLKIYGISTKDSLFVLFKPHHYFLASALNVDYFIVYYDNYLMEDNSFVKDIISLNSLFLNKSKLTCFSSMSLMEKFKNHYPSIYTPNAVSEDLLNSSVHWQNDRNRRKSIFPKTIGIVGVFTESYDYDLIGRIASTREDVKILLIGRQEVSLKKLERFKNIAILGGFEYSDMGIYLKQIDIGIVPYKQNDFNRFRSPLKIYEYFIYGLPVVSFDCEVEEGLKQLIYISVNENEFVKNIEKALSEDSDERNIKRRKIAENNTWSKRSEYIVDNVLNA